MSSSSSPDKKEITTHLKSLYSAYRGSPSIESKSLFFSEDCMQICRTDPSYSARDRRTIIKYLHDAASGEGIGGASSSGPGKTKKEGWTVRSLRSEEENHGEGEEGYNGFGGGHDEITKPAGFTVGELKNKAEGEGWVGLRVDLWFWDEDENENEDGRKKNGGGLLVKVNYWWRKEQGKDGAEEEEWKQILHDIIYIGALDGTEGTQGEEDP